MPCRDTDRISGVITRNCRKHSGLAGFDILHRGNAPLANLAKSRAKRLARARNRHARQTGNIRQACRPALRSTQGPGDGRDIAAVGRLQDGQTAFVT